MFGTDSQHQCSHERHLRKRASRAALKMAQMLGEVCLKWGGRFWGGVSSGVTLCNTFLKLKHASI